jgi:hypothetical protein
MPHEVREELKGLWAALTIFNPEFEKCELTTQTSGNPIGIVDAILRPVKERWGPQRDSHRLKNRCGDKEIVLRWRIDGPQFCYGPQLKKIVLTVTRKEYAAPSADARIHFHCRSILDYGGCTSRANVAATNNGKTSVASANTWAKYELMRVHGRRGGAPLLRIRSLRGSFPTKQPRPVVHQSRNHRTLGRCSKSEMPKI